MLKEKKMSLGEILSLSKKDAAKKRTHERYRKIREADPFLKSQYPEVRRFFQHIKMELALAIESPSDTPRVSSQGQGEFLNSRLLAEDDGCLWIEDHLCPFHDLWLDLHDWAALNELQIHTIPYPDDEVMSDDYIIFEAFPDLPSKR